MPNILLISLVFAPDGVSTAQLMSDLVVDLRAAGHKVSVVTTQPHYNQDGPAEAAQPLASRWFGLLYDSTYLGTPVIHTRMPRKRGGFLARLWGFLLFHVLALVAGLALVETPDAVLVPSPLLTAGLLGWIVARLRGAAFVYNVQELYPDIAVKMGHLKNPLLVRLLRCLERFIYRHAETVTVISPGMARAVTDCGVPVSRVRVIPNFVDTNQMRPGPRDNPFSKAHRLDGRFVVCYAGNMGFAQGVEVILDAAELLRDRSEIHFLFVGDGAQRETLIETAKSKALSNVQFIPHQPYGSVPDIYAASDLCVVPMLHGIGAEGVPSKFMRIMACGRPVLAITDAASDLADEVLASSGGAVVPPSSPTAVANAILMFRDSPERCVAAGQAGRAYASNRYAREVVTRSYATLFRGITRAPEAHAVSR